MRTNLSAALMGSVLLWSLAAPANAQPNAAADPVEALADSLADCPPAAAGKLNPDGTAPDVACTRQWVKGKVVRQNIQMSFELGSARLTASGWPHALSACMYMSLSV